MGVMGPYAGADYNITNVHSIVDSNTFSMGLPIGQPYARVDLNHIPESTLSPSQRFWILPLLSSYHWRPVAAFESLRNCSK